MILFLLLVASRYGPGRGDTCNQVHPKTGFVYMAASTEIEQHLSHVDPPTQPEQLFPPSEVNTCREIPVRGFRLVIFSLIPAIILLLLLEGIAWFFYGHVTSPVFRQFRNPEWNDQRFFVTDPDLFWRFKPGITVDGNNPSSEVYSISINRDGFRGGNWDDPTIMDSIRIMFVGDSCVFGWDAPDGKTFPDRLLEHMSEGYPGKHFHSFSAAVPGYSSYQAKIAVMKYLPLYCPDLLIIWCGTNDAVPAIGLSDNEMGQAPFFSPIWVGVREGSHFMRWFQDRWMPPRKTSPPSPDFPRVALDDFERNLEAVRILCERQGVPFAVLTRQDLRDNPPVRPYNQKLKAWAATHGVVQVPIVAAFNSAKDPRSLYAKPETDYIHPNEKGYALVAQITYQTLKDAGYLNWK